MESITNFSVGIFLRYTCHKTKYTRKQGLKSVFELETEGKNWSSSKIMQVQQSANEHITRILGYSKDDAYLPRDQAFLPKLQRSWWDNNCN